jgi:hypothetical protein
MVLFLMLLTAQRYKKFWERPNSFNTWSNGERDVELLATNLLNLLGDRAGIFAKILYICTDMLTCNITLSTVNKMGEEHDC